MSASGSAAPIQKPVSGLTKIPDSERKRAVDGSGPIAIAKLIAKGVAC